MDAQNIAIIKDANEIAHSIKSDQTAPITGAV